MLAQFGTAQTLFSSFLPDMIWYPCAIVEYHLTLLPLMQVTDRMEP